MLFFHLFFFLSTICIHSCWCQQVNQVVVPVGEPFAFDCHQDESVYYGQRRGQWSEIKDDEQIATSGNYLNLHFTYPTGKNILRVQAESAQPKHAGFYACRKGSIKNIYHLVLADVQKFYWTFVCNGPVGSCVRFDDASDEALSTLEVADQTNIEIYCCASVTGYNNVDIRMNPVGENRNPVNIERKQEVDGTWVSCANQRTLLKRRYNQNQQTLTCELITDGRSYSTLSSVIVMKDEILPDPDVDSSVVNPPPPDDYPMDPFFTSSSSSIGGKGRKKKTGKRIAIILGSIGGALLLIGLLVVLFCFLRKKAPSNTSRATRKNANVYEQVRAPFRLARNPQAVPDVEPVYEEPVPLYENMPIHLRL